MIKLFVNKQRINMNLQKVTLKTQQKLIEMSVKAITSKKANQLMKTYYTILFREIAMRNNYN